MSCLITPRTLSMHAQHCFLLLGRKYLSPASDFSHAASAGWVQFLALAIWLESTESYEAWPPHLSLGACGSLVLCRAPGLQAETAEPTSVTLISGAWNFILKVQGCYWWVLMAGAFCQLQLWPEIRGEGSTSLSWLRFAEKILLRTCVERKLSLTYKSA